MFSQLKQFHILKHKLSNFSKLYSSDKLKKDISVQKEKKTTILQESPDVIAQRYEECAELEGKILKQVLVEKEKEATLQSRLSKECKTLFATPVSKLGAVKCPVLHLNQIPLQNAPDSQGWGTYPFDHLQSHITEKLLADNTKDPPKKEGSISVTNEGTMSVTNEGTPIAILSGATGPETGGAGVIPGGGNTGGISATRPIRQEPGKVIFRFIPQEWWLTFIPKTGVTGFGTFLFTFTLFLVSKEIYVLEHYYYHGLSSLILWICGIKYVGPFVTKMVDKDLDEFEKAWNKGRVQEKQALEDNIVHEIFRQFQMEGQLLLNNAKRENVHLQLEEEYRKRQMMVYDEVKQRLDYHIALELVKQRIQQKNLVEYVTREVKKAITPDMQNKLIYYSIDRIVDDLNQAKK